MPRLTKHELATRDAVGALMERYGVTLRFMTFGPEFVNEHTWRRRKNRNLPSCSYGWCMVEVTVPSGKEEGRVPGALLKQKSPAAAMTWIARNRKLGTQIRQKLGDDFIARLLELVATKAKRGRPRAARRGD